MGKYQPDYAPEAVCAFDGCSRRPVAKLLCHAHRKQQMTGKPLSPLKPKIVRRTSEDVRAEVSRGFKTCAGKISCGRALPLDAFYALSSGRYFSHCKECGSKGSILRLYGLTREQWNELFDRQGQCCAICGTDDPVHAKGWATDHSHKCCPGQKSCGKCVRAILCQKCNTTVGFIETHPDIAAVFKYLDVEALKDK